MEAYTTCFGNLNEDALTSFTRMSLGNLESKLDDNQLNCFMLFLVMNFDTDSYRRYKARRLIQDKMGEDPFDRLQDLVSSISDADLSACHALLPQYSAYVESVSFENESAIQHAVESTPLPTSVDPVGACCAAAVLVATHTTNPTLKSNAVELVAKDSEVTLSPNNVKVRGYDFLMRTSMQFLVKIPQEIYSRYFSEFERYLICQLTA